MLYISYNGVILRDLEVKQFQQDIVQDESRTDVLYNRFDITVSATITDWYASGSETDGTTISVGNANIVQTGDRIQRLQQKLTSARKDFYFIVGGQKFGETVMLAVSGSADDGGFPAHPFVAEPTILDRRIYCDVENGPHPELLTVEQFFGGKAARVTVKFRIAQLVCDLEFEDGYPIEDPELPWTPNSFVLSNRWSLTESKDENWQTTRQISGTLRTRHTRYYAQQYRNLVIPPLNVGYKRESQRFASDPTNLTLKYTITDKQIHASPPPPAIKWSGTYTETQTHMASRQLANFAIRLQGPPGVDKAKLIETGLYILTQRVPDLQKDYGNLNEKFNTKIMNMAFVDHMAEPTIEITARIEYLVPEDQNTYLMMRIQDFSPPDPTYGIDGYDPTVSPVPLAYDSTTPAGAFACYLQDPCSVYHSHNYPAVGESNYRQDEVGLYPDDSYEYPEQEPLPFDNRGLLKYDTASVKPAERYDIYKYPYTQYIVTQRYETSSGAMHLPLSHAVTSSPNSEANPLTAIAIPIHAGICRRIMTIETSRDGRAPVVPQFLPELVDDNGITETLLHVDFAPMAPELQPDSVTKRFGFTGTVIYGLSRPPTAAEKLRAGSQPMDNDQPLSTLFDLTDQLDTESRIDTNIAPGTQEADAAIAAAEQRYADLHKEN